MTTPSARGSRVARFAFAAFIALFVIAALEGLLALFGLPPAPSAGAASALAARTPVDLDVYEPDPLLLWRLRRSTVIVAPGLGFDSMRTNAAGLRGAELPAPPPRDPSELVVLCLGDSVTNGMNLREEETYPAQLSATLITRLPERRVRVVNAGVPGHSFVQGSRLFDELRAIRPDVVISWYGLNDAKPAMGVPDAQYKMPSSGTIRTQAALRHSRIYRVIEALASPAATDARRSTPGETAACAAHIADAATQDGFASLYVRGPTRLAEKQQQLDRILAAATGANASVVDASFFVLSPYVCAIAQTERLVRTEAGVAYFDDANEPRLRLGVSELTTRRSEVRAWREQYEAHAAALPPGAIDGTALLGGLAPSAAFEDCVHFTPAGAASVGERLADAVIDALSKRRR